VRRVHEFNQGTLRSEGTAHEATTASGQVPSYIAVHSLGLLMTYNVFQTLARLLAMCAQTSPPLDEDYVPAPGMKQRICVLP
jgi:hypothetical protein